MASKSKKAATNGINNNIRTTAEHTGVDNAKSIVDVNGTVSAEDNTSATVGIDAETVMDEGNETDMNTAAGSDDATGLNTAHENGDGSVVEPENNNDSTIGNGIDIDEVFPKAGVDNAADEPTDGNDAAENVDVGAGTSVENVITNNNSTVPSWMVQGFPYEVLTEWARNQVICVSQTMQAAVPLAANLVLTLVSACIARIVYVLTGAQCEPTNIWTMTLAEPGERKTPVFSRMMEPFINSPLAAHIVGDTTVARFIRRLDSEGRLFGIGDEPVLLNKLTGTTEISPESILKSYNETLFTYDRCDCGTILLNRPSLTMGFAGQPDVFKRKYNDSKGQALRDSGYFDRTAIVITQSLTGHRNLMQDEPQNAQEINDTYCDYMSTMAGLEQYMTPEIPTIQLALSPEAEYLRRQLLMEWENDIETNEDIWMIRGWVSKAGGFVLRLAAILYMMDLVVQGNPNDIDNPPPITGDVMKRAIRLLSYYRDMTIDWTRYVTTEPLSTLAQRIWGFICRHGKQEYSMRTVKQGVRSANGSLDDDAFDAAIQELVEKAWIVVEAPAPKPKKPGRPPSARIRVIRGQEQNVAA